MGLRFLFSAHIFPVIGGIPFQAFCFSVSADWLKVLSKKQSLQLLCIIKYLDLF